MLEPFYIYFRWLVIKVLNKIVTSFQTKLEKIQNKMTKLMNFGEIMRPEERNRIMNLTTHKESSTYYSHDKRGTIIASKV